VRSARDALDRASCPLRGEGQERYRESRNIGRALIAVPLQASENDLLKLRGAISPKGAYARNALGIDLQNDLGEGLTVERLPTGEQFEQDDSEGPDVRARVHVA
jgi:hypothetical protein